MTGFSRGCAMMAVVDRMRTLAAADSTTFSPVHRGPAL
jgi:hypothetical protein